MRISDWSSDVCSSDLDPVMIEHVGDAVGGLQLGGRRGGAVRRRRRFRGLQRGGDAHAAVIVILRRQDDRLVAQRAADLRHRLGGGPRSEEHTSELQSLMRISYAVFCLKKKNNN